MRHVTSLREALRGLLQYDRGDLDFGIYRILNRRREEIDKFLDQSLLAAVESALGEGEGGDADEAAGRLCADLARFFERYYDSGDFLPLRRYRIGTYSVPYEGEEVLLHWANRDQFYIKSDEQLYNYRFALADGRSVRFSIVPKADEDPLPLEAQRRYSLGDPATELEDADTLLVRWNFVAKEKGIKQADLNEAACERLLNDSDLGEEWRSALAAPPAEGSNPSLLARHVATFTARNSYDYFVHRDLGSFLRGELEAFLKSDLIRLDEQNDAAALEHSVARLRAARAVALPVIEFLAQVEDFQKRLWLKRKLALESNWLVTLDLLPPELLEEVAACESQHLAWIEELGAESLEGWTSPPSTAFLGLNSGLVLDTTHFDRDFTRRLLAAVPDLEAATIGWAVNGDCFQALRFLQPRFEGQVQASYIDPPYNTGGGDFLYKDRYPHSSWLSMVRDRVALGRELLAEDGVQVTSIDDDEHPRLRLVLDEIFGPDNFAANVVWQKKYAPSEATWFSDDHDHLLFYAKAKELWRPERLARTAETDKLYKSRDDDPRGAWMSDNYTQSKTKDERPNGWYAIKRPADGEEIWPEPTRVWAYAETEHLENEKDNRVWWGTDGLNDTPRIKRFLSEVSGLVPRTVWTHQDAGHNQDAVRDLKGLFEQNPFRNPKPLRLLRRILSICPGDLVLDYFAGSGTLGHAVIAERREGVAQRQFVLAEQGPHFETVLRPRLTKALHAGQWSKGEPQTRDHVSGMVQLIRLESYEDALDSIELVRSEAQATLLDSADGVADDYFLRYWLPTEGRARIGDAEVFRAPFSVSSTATVGGVRIEARPDLPETFSWLIGLRPSRFASDPGLLAIRGRGRNDCETLVVWRDREQVDDERFERWFLALPPELRDERLAVVYVNGDTDLERRRPEGESWVVRLTEDAFVEAMFDELAAP